MRFLGIDTSNDILDIAVIDEGKVLAQVKNEGKREHSKKVALAVKEAMAQADLEFADLDCFAAVNFPGSYTGLRIGASLAMGLAFGVNKPVYGVDNKDNWQDIMENDFKELKLEYINDKWS